MYWGEGDAWWGTWKGDALSMGWTRLLRLSIICIRVGRVIQVHMWSIPCGWCSHLSHGSKDIMCNVSFAWCAGWGRVFGGKHMCIIKNHDSPDVPCGHLRFSQARQHVVDFVHSYRLCLALPNTASVSFLVSLYYIPTMCGEYSCNLCHGVTGHTHWVRGWCEETMCCAL